MSKTYRSEASANRALVESGLTHGLPFGLPKGSRPTKWKRFSDGYDPRNSADRRPQYSDVIEYQPAERTSDEAEA